jgi:hypothetical protein
MDGSELKPEAPTLQGPTREEVADEIYRVSQQIVKRTISNAEGERVILSPAPAGCLQIADALALLKPTSPWRDEKAAILDIVQQVHSDLQFTMIALQNNDPNAEIVIRVSDVLGIIQEKLAPLLKPLPALPSGETGT